MRYSIFTIFWDLFFHLMSFGSFRFKFVEQFYNNCLTCTFTLLFTHFYIFFYKMYIKFFVNSKKKKLYVESCTMSIYLLFSVVDVVHFKYFEFFSIFFYFLRESFQNTLFFSILGLCPIPLKWANRQKFCYK